jgi:predicted ArsR family transcriptional regulator
MQNNNRARQHELTTHLKAASTSLEVVHLKEWLTLLLDEAKNNLVASAATDIIRQQGEAQAYQKMLNQLNRSGLMPQTNEATNGN